MAPNQSADPSGGDWWQEFFESPDCFPLSFFPTAAETDQEVAGLERLLDLQHGQPILDVCCGAGRHLLPLSARGFAVTGLDVSALMLSRAQHAAQVQGSPVRLVRGDARHLPFASDGLQVVLNLFNSFGYCERDEDNELVLREAARCLAPGGQFLLETRNAQHQILFAPLRRLIRGASGAPLVTTCRYDRQRRRLNCAWREARGGRLVHYASLRLYQSEELLAMARRAGLELIGLYGGFEGSAFDGFERLLLYHGRKR
jgi:SAM-dependent methyltransferase